MYRVHFRDFVGRAWLTLWLRTDVPEEPEQVLSVPLEVRSRKLNYEDEYGLLLEDLMRHGIELLLDRRSPVGFPIHLVDTRRSDNAIEHLWVYKTLLRQPRFVQALQQIATNPRKIRRAQERWRATSTARRRPAIQLFRGIQRAQPLMPVQRRPDASCTSQTMWLPLRFPERSWVDSWDCLENRFVSWLYAEMTRRLNDLRQSFSTRQAAHLKREAEQLLAQVRLHFGHLPFFYEMNGPEWQRSIQKMRPASFSGSASTLSAQPGYGALWAWSVELDAALGLSWPALRMLLYGPLREMSRLYEYWAFVILWRALCRVAEPCSAHTPWLTLDAHADSSTLLRGVPSGLHFRYKSLELGLFYQFRFIPGTQIGQSYSVPLTPDFSLFLFRDAQPWKVLCFDAKYRTQSSLDKMHAYRDALHAVEGVYLLHPGENEQS
ncbi:MAG: DUF2357 domain-containing protein, partial [Myxococcota bacterium]